VGTRSIENSQGQRRKIQRIDGLHGFTGRQRGPFSLAICGGASHYTTHGRSARPNGYRWIGGLLRWLVGLELWDLHPMLVVLIPVSEGLCFSLGFFRVFF
jgi:hypothetical protein